MRAQVLARRRGQSSDFCLLAARAAAASKPRCVADAIESHDGNSEESNGFHSRWRSSAARAASSAMPGFEGGAAALARQG